MRTADDHVDAEERYLIDAINALRREYEQAAKPYVDRLVYLRSIRAPRYILSVDEAAAFAA